MAMQVVKGGRPSERLAGEVLIVIEVERAENFEHRFVLEGAFPNLRPRCYSTGVIPAFF